MSRSPVQIRREAPLEPQALQRKLGGLFVGMGVKKGERFDRWQTLPAHRPKTLLHCPDQFAGAEITELLRN